MLVGICLAEVFLHKMVNSSELNGYRQHIDPEYEEKASEKEKKMNSQMLVCSYEVVKKYFCYLN